MEGIDYNGVFSLVTKHSSIRILLALVGQMNMDLVLLDIKPAYLHGDLEDKIYMTQLEGFKAVGKERMVCKLKDFFMVWSNLQGSGMSSLISLWVVRGTQEESLIILCNF